MKKTLSVILAIIMIMATLATMSVGAEANVSEWDGASKDTSWYDVNSTTKTATIYNAAQLAGFVEISQTETFADWTIKLGTDIVWNKGDASTYEATAPAYVWTPIGDFWGTFDGQGHVVSGLYFNDDKKVDIGFFASLNGGTVKNLSVVNSYFCGRQQIGGIAGKAHEYKVIIENCYTDTIIHAYPLSKDKSLSGSDGGRVGGIIGCNMIRDTVISNCWTEGTLIAYAPWDGNGKSDGTDNNAAAVGGIVGINFKAILTVKDCMSTAYLEGHTMLGGIIGRTGGVESNGTTVENCIFLGKSFITREKDINSDGSPKTNTFPSYSGSIVGIVMSQQATIKNCYAPDTFAATYMKPTLMDQTNKTAFWSTNNPSKGYLTEDSTMISVSEASIKGGAAKTTLAGFDFTNIWAVGENGPEIAALSYVAKNKVSNVPASVPEDQPKDTTPVDTDPAETKPVDTTAPETNAPETQAPETNAPETNTPETSSPDTEAPAKSGCGASVGMAAFAVVAVVSAVAFAGKKRED